MRAFACFGFFVLMVVSCATPTVLDDDSGVPDSGKLDGGGCPIVTQKKCGTQCVDTTKDTANCGACGTKCVANQYCAGGKCTDGCNAPFKLCGQFCVDLDSDHENCGTCGKGCASDQECKQKACIKKCPLGLTVCDPDCVDTTIDTNHCGMCNNLCPSGICSGGKCVGANPGHVALYCLDYAWAQATTAHTVLLGNAVFLPLRSEVRILAYTRYAPAAVRNQVNRVIAWSPTARGKTYRIDPITQANLLSTELNVQDYDVFLIYEQADAPAVSSPRSAQLGKPRAFCNRSPKPAGSSLRSTARKVRPRWRPSSMRPDCSQ